MDKRYTVAVLGCGARGYCYTELLLRTGKFQITALCDWNKEQIKKIHNAFGLENAEDFLEAEAFLAEKRADVLVIATDDRAHVPQCIKALELGYDVLLEKPISDKREEIKRLLETQRRTGKKVIVCHELRYGAGFRKCAELIRSGAIGRLYAINASERVAYWHWVQAYVRGVGSSLEKGHPAILAKCSHDLDLIQWYADSKCDAVSSVGELLFFKPENAPEGASDRCVDCKYIDTCPYSAKRIYVDGWRQKKPTYSWPYSKVVIQNPTTEDALWQGIKNGIYGQCVFRCQVEKTDHQLVQMKFENGVKASLTMAYSAQAGRMIVFYGTYGEIVIDERRGEIELMVYGEPKQTIKLSTILTGGNAHGGGDAVMINELYDIISGRSPNPTPLAESLECHLMGIAAEESRLNGGVLVKVHQE